MVRGGCGLGGHCLEDGNFRGVIEYDEEKGSAGTKEQGAHMMGRQESARPRDSRG